MVAWASSQNGMPFPTSRLAPVIGTPRFSSLIPNMCPSTSVASTFTLCAISGDPTLSKLYDHTFTLYACTQRQTTKRPTTQ